MTSGAAAVLVLVLVLGLVGLNRPACTAARASGSRQGHDMDAAGRNGGA